MASNRLVFPEPFCPVKALVSGRKSKEESV